MATELKCQYDGELIRRLSHQSSNTCTEKSQVCNAFLFSPLLKERKRNNNSNLVDEPAKTSKLVVKLVMYPIKINKKTVASPQQGCI